MIKLINYLLFRYYLEITTLCSFYLDQNFLLYVTWLFLHNYKLQILWHLAAA